MKISNFQILVLRRNVYDECFINRCFIQNPKNKKKIWQDALFWRLLLFKCCLLMLHWYAEFFFPFLFFCWILFWKGSERNDCLVPFWFFVDCGCGYFSSKYNFTIKNCSINYNWNSRKRNYFFFKVQFNQSFHFVFFLGIKDICKCGRKLVESNRCHWWKHFNCCILQF